MRGYPALFYEAEDEVSNPDFPLPIVDSTEPDDITTLNGLRRSLPLRSVLSQRWRQPQMQQAPRRNRGDE